LGLIWLFKPLLVGDEVCQEGSGPDPAELPSANRPQNQVVEYVQQPNVVYVQAPVVNISNRHGNLRSAQQDIVNAYQKIQNAQAANDGQLGGHAQRAKDLLAQADAELRLAANVANSEGR
jgi:hypothetical protein